MTDDTLFRRVARKLMPKNPLGPSPSFIKRIVMMLSRGNINLQKGRYITREQLDKRWEKIKRTDFSTL